MRPQAHIAASLLIWRVGRGPAWEAPLDALAGNLPDLDRNVARALGVTRRDHHRWVSHSLVGWGPPTVLALRLAHGRRSGAAVRRGVLALWVHLLLDTYADGLAWLWPDERKLGFFLRDERFTDDGWNTPGAWGTTLGRTEAAMWGALALSLALRRRG